ncbi:uncharacterized protein METZ01_LOCUS440939, partial [marine metagenome]
MHVENCAESATTANPHTRQTTATSQAGPPNKKPMMMQHAPLTIILTMVIKVLPIRSASTPAAAEPSPP